MKPLELDPWVISDLLICSRDGQLISIEFATDAEFDAWVQKNSVRIQENGVTGWTFDDRCRLINHVLRYGGTLEFADGTRIPDRTNSGNSAGKRTNEETQTNSPENDEPPNIIA